MKLNEAGYKLICKFEGLKLKPYLCSAKIPTIGYGNTYYPDGKRVTLLDKEITKEHAFDIFKEVADRFAKRVDTLVTKPLTQNQFNALVSFAYNVGTGSFQSSTLLKKVNINPNDLTIRAEFLRWNKANKVVVNGLTIRRTEESKLYFTR
jgi:lysozyme